MASIALPVPTSVREITRDVALGSRQRNLINLQGTHGPALNLRALGARKASASSYPSIQSIQLVFRDVHLRQWLDCNGDRGVQCCDSAQKPISRSNMQCLQTSWNLKAFHCMHFLISCDPRRSAQVCAEAAASTIVHWSNSTAAQPSIRCR